MLNIEKTTSIPKNSLISSSVIGDKLEIIKVKVEKEEKIFLKNKNELLTNINGQNILDILDIKYLPEILEMGNEFGNIKNRILNIHIKFKLEKDEANLWFHNNSKDVFDISLVDSEIESDGMIYYQGEFIKLKELNYLNSKSEYLVGLNGFNKGENFDFSKFKRTKFFAYEYNNKTIILTSIKSNKYYLIFDQKFEDLFEFKENYYLYFNSKRLKEYIIKCIKENKDEINDEENAINFLEKQFRKKESNNMLCGSLFFKERIYKVFLEENINSLFLIYKL